MSSEKNTGKIIKLVILNMKVEYEISGRLLESIARRKVQMGKEIQRKIFDQSSMTERKDHPLLNYDKPFGVINGYCGGQQIFVPQAVDSLIKLNMIPKELGLEDGRAALIMAYLFSEKVEYILDVGENANDRHFPLVTRLDGELKRFGMVRRWGAEPRIPSKRRFNYSCLDG